MHNIERRNLRINTHEHGGNNREILGHVVGDGKSREHAPRHEHLLADLHHFQEFGRIGIQIDHVTGFFSRLRSSVHRHADICLRQSRGIVRAVAGHGDQLTFGLFFSDEPHLRFRCRLREEIIDTRFPSDRRRSARIVSGNHHRANTHSPEALEALADAALDHVLQMNNTENFISLCDHQRGSSGIGDPMGDAFDLRADRAAQFVNVLLRSHRRHPCEFCVRQDRNRSSGFPR